MIEFFAAGIILVTLTFLVLVHKENFLIGFVIITLFTVTSELGSVLRLFIHLTDVSVLAYLFIRTYGFKFSEYPSVPRLLVIFLCLYFSALIISTTFSDFPVAGIINILRTILFFTIVYMLYGLTRTRKNVDTILIALFLTSVILSASIIIDFFLHGGNLSYILQPVRYRGFGLYDNFNIVGMYLIEFFPFLIVALYSQKYSRYKPLIIFVAFLMILSSILIASRAALAGMILGGTFIFAFFNRKIFYTSLTCIGIALFIYFVYNPFPQFDVVLRLEEGLSMHDIFWRLAFDIIRDHPITGIGPGAYHYVQFNYLPVMLSSYAGSVIVGYNALNNMSHNYFLVFFSDMGLLGIISAFFLPVVFFRYLIVTIKKYKNVDGNAYLILLAIFAVGILMFLRSIIESIGILFYGYLSYDLAFWLLIVILISLFEDRLGILHRDSALK